MIKLEYTYTNLPKIFYSKTIPSSAVAPSLIKYNDDLGKLLQLDFTGDEKLSFLSGNLSNTNVLSMNYAGHQFGRFNPQLGDGRAALIGEVVRNNIRYDLHLKGCGITKYSRGGDGRLYLGPAIREYLVSEAMFYLGISTSRALSIVSTGEKVIRERSYPGATLMRVSKGHIRVGTFEFFLYRHMIKELNILTEYCIERFNPDLIGASNRKFEFFKSVAKNQLKLVLKWMSVGFIHGVMNTDNMNISGETIDYGPCAFLDTYIKNKVFSSIDQHGRYAYFNQSKIALWNLSSLANCILATESSPDLESKKYLELFEELESFYQDEYLKIFCHKLGIKNPRKTDINIINKFLENMEKNRLDFTNTFFNLSNDLDSYDFLKDRLSEDQSLEQAFELMKKTNPYIIPRNHLIHKSIDNAINGDMSLFEKFNTALKSPFEINDLTKQFAQQPKESEIIHKTFCGT